ncbi:NADH-quinone oxidoreductase subunit C [Streptomyces sp. NPDC016562]|uniref:NADH-quinone oxidoreductase subunit C n=1 Tax=Streptomyces sp. NPDC016562 TaxID=3364966 RepID=UPI0036F92FB2
MNLYDTLPDAAPTIFGEEAVGSYAYEVLTVDVPVGSWIAALEIARDKLGCTYFDWLSAVDEPGTGLRICAHVVSLENHRVRRLLLRTTVPHAAPSLPSAVAVYAGAQWHERETFEMFGVTFTDHPNLVHLLLPENFEGHPLRKDFVLAARVAKAWPGAKEPGEAHDPDAPKRRQMLPPGVPDPNDWGPMKGQLPPAPARPARTPRAAGAAREGAPTRRPRPSTPDPTAAPDTEAPTRPPRRTRSVTEGSASQAPEPAPSPDAVSPDTPRPPRRTRSVTEGSASQTIEPETPATPAASGTDSPSPEATPATPSGPAADATRPPRRTRSASEGSASQTAEPEATATPAASGTDSPSPEATPATPSGPAADAMRPPRRTRSASEGSASQATPPPATRRPAPRSADAPWHNPKPAFEEAEPPSPAPEAAPPKPAGEAQAKTPPTAPEAPGTDSTHSTPTDPNPDNGGDA